jgi:hypothetical protein
MKRFEFMVRLCCAGTLGFICLDWSLQYLGPSMM